MARLAGIRAVKPQRLTLADATLLADGGVDGIALRLDSHNPRPVDGRRRKLVVTVNPHVPADTVVATLRALADQIEQG